MIGGIFARLSNSVFVWPARTESPAHLQLLRRMQWVRKEPEHGLSSQALSVNPSRSSITVSLQILCSTLRSEKSREDFRLFGVNFAHEKPKFRFSSLVDVLKLTAQTGKSTSVLSDPLGSGRIELEASVENDSARWLFSRRLTPRGRSI